VFFDKFLILPLTMASQEPPAEEIEKLYGTRFATLEKLETAVILLPEKTKLLAELKVHRLKVLETNAVLKTCKDLMADRLNLQQKYETVTQISRKMTLLMLEQIESSNVPSPALPSSPNPAPQFQRAPLTNSQQINRLQISDTPARMSLAEYAVSPFVTRIKPQKLEFLDFDSVQIKESDFQKIPRYMRNRDTLPDLQNFMETTIIPCFTDKYTMVYRKRECVRHPADLDKWKLYQSQTSYFPGRDTMFSFKIN
jgi:hypothetical protein